MEEVLTQIEDTHAQNIAGWEREVELLKDEINQLYSKADTYKIYKDKFDKFAEDKNIELEKAQELFN